MRKPVVVFAINDMLIGGAQRIYIDLMRSLKDDFEIYLLTMFQFPDKKELYEAIPAGIVIHRLNFGGFTDIASWTQLFGTLRDSKPDVVISSLFFANTTTRVLKLILGYKSIAIEHNTYVSKTHTQILTDRILSSLSYRIVAVSKSVAKFTGKQEGISADKFVIIHDGIDLQTVQHILNETNKEKIRAELDLSDDDRLVVNVGRLTKQKNQDALIEAFAEFAKTHPNYKLLILGEGSLRESLEKKIVSLGVKSSIILAGAKESVIPYFAVADFFVSTSHIEGFGVAHAEALACGLPLLSTKTAGPDEMIEEGKNGFFIVDTLPQAIREGLERMSKLDLKEMKAACRERAKRYDIRQTVQIYRKLIHAAL